MKGLTESVSEVPTDTGIVGSSILRSPEFDGISIDALVEQKASAYQAGVCEWLAPLREAFAFEYRGHRLFDPCHPRRRLPGSGKMVEVTPLPPRRQRLEGALETRVSSESLRQFLGNRKI